MRWAGCALAIVLTGLVASVGTAQVVIVSPRDGETVRSRRLTVRVQKPTDDGYVMVWLDGKFVAAVSAPFEMTLDLAERDALTGSHTLRVVGVDKSHRVEGEAQVQFQVDLTGAGLAQGETQLTFQGRTGEIFSYSFRGVSETKVEVPTKAIRRKVPHLSSKLTFRWLQTVRDITVDRLLRLVRSVEEGTLEREAPIAPAGVGMGMMGGEAMAPMSGAPMGGPMMGAPWAGGVPAPMGAPMTGMPMASATNPTRLRLQPIESQRLGFLTLLPNGEVVTGQELPSVVRFITASIDLSTPARPLRIGEVWQGRMVLPRNLENLTLVGAPMGAGGFGGEEAVGPFGAPFPYGAPSGSAPYGPIAPGMGAPMGRPSSPMGMPGPLGVPNLPGAAVGATGTVERNADAFLADAPVIQVPAVHRLDGFEMWRDVLCARIVSRFKIAAELDIAGTQQAAGMGMGEGMTPMGAPMIGAPFRGGTPPMAGVPTGPMPFGGTTGQMPTARKLTGIGEGTRTLLFDLQNGRVVYAKVEVKVTFTTDYLSVLPLLQQTQQPSASMTGTPYGQPASPMPGAFGPGMAPMPGALGQPPMFRGMPGVGMESAPGAESPMPGAPSPPPYGTPFSGAPSAVTPPFRNVAAKVLYTYTVENTLEASGRLDMALKYLGSRH
ncbi:hypothetical protein HRbin17_01916 [bacterium HR17]|uniref:Uncharacterized protein n=1 Tax=Candidatus Fervidibacter japonicus TaxID=2035412 RepID=A0A2H5XDY8_9BACT|nr:hypothetical protein HRbin17_01916 [bacterium HR17]